MDEQTLAILLASAFTFGWAAIQTLERHARAMTAILSVIVLCLGPFVGLVALAQKAKPSARHEHLPIAWNPQ